LVVEIFANPAIFSSIQKKKTKFFLDMPTELYAKRAHNLKGLFRLKVEN